MTVLPEEAKLRRVLGRMRGFHDELLSRYLAPGERVVEDATPTPCEARYGSEAQLEVVEAHLRGASRGHEQPHMLLLLGGSGAGKGTFLRAMGARGLAVGDFVMHGLDEYIAHLPEYRSSTSSPRVVYRDAADGCYRGAIPIAKAAQAELLRRRQHVIYEDTGKDLGRLLERVLPPFEAAGYRIALALVDNAPEVARRRAPQRFLREGRFSPEAYIDASYRNVPENYARLRDMALVKESVYCDNSCLSEESGESRKEGGCLKCWLDKGSPPSRLFPSGALLEGAPVRLSAAAQ